MIHISLPAATEIKRLRTKQRQSNLFRLSVQPGGCSGWFYQMNFDENTKAGDRVHECSGITVVVDEQSWKHIRNLKIDYSEDLMGGGFRFHNLEVLSICSCGNSFNLNTSAQPSAQKL